MSCTNSFAVAPSYKPVRQCTGDCCRLTPSISWYPESVPQCNDQEGAFWVEAWQGVPGASGSTGISAVSLSLCDALQFYTAGNMLLDVNSGSAQVSINANNIISGAGAPTSSPPTTSYPFLYYDNTDPTKVYIWSVTTNSWTQITGAGGVSTFSAGTSGLTPSVPTSGAITLGLGTTATSAPLTLVSRDANSNMSANNIALGVTVNTTTGGTTALSATSGANQVFNGSSSQTVTLPNTSTILLGTQYQITNLSSGTVTVQTFSGAALSPAVALMQNQVTVATCISTAGANTAAEWIATVVNVGGSSAASGFAPVGYIWASNFSSKTGGAVLPLNSIATIPAGATLIATTRCVCASYSGTEESIMIDSVGTVIAKPLTPSSVAGIGAPLTLVSASTTAVASAAIVGNTITLTKIGTGIGTMSVVTMSAPGLINYSASSTSASGSVSIVGLSFIPPYATWSRNVSIAGTFTISCSATWVDGETVTITINNSGATAGSPPWLSSYYIQRIA